jgi:hypothetical protein
LGIAPADSLEDFRTEPLRIDVTNGIWQLDIGKRLMHEGPVALYAVPRLRQLR